MECRDSATFLKLTAWIMRFINNVIGDMNDGGMILLTKGTQKI